MAGNGGVVGTFRGKGKGKRGQGKGKLRNKKNKSGTGKKQDRLSSRAARASPSSREERITITKGASIPVPDTYLCISKPAPVNLSHVVSFQPFEPEAYMHHLILFACEYPLMPEGEVWNCGMGMPSCHDKPTLMYAWALQAPGLDLPEGIGQVVGGMTTLKHFVLQAHYTNAHVDGLPGDVGLSLLLRPGLPGKFGGMMVFAGADFHVPPDTPALNVTVSCIYEQEQPLHFFAYRVHTHDLGKRVTGQLHTTNQSTPHTLADRSPQRPQIFTPLAEPTTILQGTEVEATCEYDSR